MTRYEKSELLGKIEKELICILNFYEEDQQETEKFLRKEISDHLKCLHAYNKGAINTLKTAINEIRKYY